MNDPRNDMNSWSVGKYAKRSAMIHLNSAAMDEAPAVTDTGSVFLGRNGDNQDPKTQANRESEVGVIHRSYEEDDAEHLVLSVVDVTAQMAQDITSRTFVRLRDSGGVTPVGVNDGWTEPLELVGDTMVKNDGRGTSSLNLFVDVPPAYAHLKPKLAPNINPSGHIYSIDPGNDNRTAPVMGRVLQNSTELPVVDVVEGVTKIVLNDISSSKSLTDSPFSRVFEGVNRSKTFYIVISKDAATGEAVNGSAGAYNDIHVNSLDGVPTPLKTTTESGVDFFWYKLVHMENIQGSNNSHTYNVATISGVHNVSDPQHPPENQPITFYDNTHLNYDFGTSSALATAFYDTLPYFWVVEVPEIRLQDRIGEHHQNYTCFIPNSIGYPEHKRCLVQVQECWLSSPTGLNNWVRQQPPLLGVELSGVAAKNVFTMSVGGRAGVAESNGNLIGVGIVELFSHPVFQNTGDVGVQSVNDNRKVSIGWRNTRSILDDGVLINTPFGRHINVKLVNMGNNKVFANTPSHVVLRLVFLDDDELPGR